MGYVLGLDIGTSRTAAAVHRDGQTGIVPLSDHTATMPSMVFVRDDATLLIGDAARRRGPEDPSRLAREFKRRFGDSAPYVLGDSAFTPEQLTSAVLRHVVDAVSANEGGPPDRVVVAHPANWGTYRRDLLRREVTTLLPTAQLVTEPAAAAVHYAASERVSIGDTVAVYDLGGGTFDAAVLRRTASGFQQVGEPKGIERLGGVDFDEAVFQSVIERAGIDTSALSAEDMPALVRLRDDCQSAKEALSDDSQATVTVALGGAQHRVVITRQAFDALIRPSIVDSVNCLRTTILDSGVPLDQIVAVLMVGGSARIPLARSLVSRELGRPVVFTSHPKEAVALGAARLGAGDITAPIPRPSLSVPVVAPVASMPAPPPPSPPSTPPPSTLPTHPPPQHVPVAAPLVPAAVARRPRNKVAPVVVGLLAVLAVGVGVAAAIAVNNTPSAAQPPASVADAGSSQTTAESTSQVPTSAPPTTSVPPTVALTAAPTTAAAPAPTVTTPPPTALLPDVPVSFAEAQAVFNDYLFFGSIDECTAAFDLLHPDERDDYPEGFDQFCNFWVSLAGTATLQSCSSRATFRSGHSLSCVVTYERLRDGTDTDEEVEVDVIRQPDGALLILDYRYIRTIR